MMLSIDAKVLLLNGGMIFLKIIAVFLFFQMLKLILKHLLRSIIKARLKNSSDARVKTLSSISDDFLKYTLNTLMIVAVIYQLGISTPLILGSLGVFSIVVGLAAQSLLNDFINGIFTVIEGYYDVGDFVKIDDFEGCVTTFGIKSTTLIDGNGRTVTIPNSRINEIVNYSKTTNFIYLQYEFNYEVDRKKISEKFKKLENVKIENTYKVNYLGISKIKLGHINFIFEVECAAVNRFQVERVFNVKIIEIVEELGIRMPSSFMRFQED